MNQPAQPQAALQTRPQMVGSIVPSAVSNLPTWAQWLLGAVIVGGIGAIAWLLMGHKGKRRRHTARASESSRGRRRRAKKRRSRK